MPQLRNTLPPKTIRRIPWKLKRFGNDGFVTVQAWRNIPGHQDADPQTGRVVEDLTGTDWSFYAIPWTFDITKGDNPTITNDTRVTGEDPIKLDQVSTNLAGGEFVLWTDHEELIPSDRRPTVNQYTNLPGWLLSVFFKDAIVGTRRSRRTCLLYTSPSPRDS